ncbi:MAG: hypothetical protein EBY22_11530 [Gammaproteobacteria bacterium]|nr:hypothetical protein [Gammaproteobacteria bacterium]
MDDILRVLREEILTAAGRNPKPSAGIIDSQTVKTAGPAIAVGCDGGKKIKGRKRHIVVDVLGLLLTVVVHSAIDWALSLFNIVWTVVKRPRKIFKIVKFRWIVERAQ